MLLIPPFGRWGYRLGQTGRPSGTAWGSTIIPGNNTMDSWTSLFLTTTDCFAIAIDISSASVSGSARACLVDIGVDPGGTGNVKVLIPSLLGGPAGSLTAQWVRYWFPLLVPANAVVKARAAVNNSLVGTIRVAVTLFGAPSTPVRYATFVEALGIVTASSQGTATTAGTTSEGSYVSLGTTSKRLWWWQMGCSLNQTAAAGNVYALDLAHDSASGSTPIITDLFATTTGRRWMARVVQLPCILCGAVPMEVHHIRDRDHHHTKVGAC